MAEMPPSKRRHWYRNFGADFLGSHGTMRALAMWAALVAYGAVTVNLGLGFAVLYAVVVIIVTGAILLSLGHRRAEFWLILVGLLAGILAELSVWNIGQQLTGEVAQEQPAAELVRSHSVGVLVVLVGTMLYLAGVLIAAYRNSKE